MPDGTQNTDTTEGGEGDTGEPVSSGAQSVEEVEAFWKNRMSGKDKAAEAERKVLRERIATLEAQTKAKPAVADGDDPRDAEIARLKQELDQTKTSSLIETRRAKYGFAAETLDDEDLARMDESRLAALNARLSDGPQTDPQRRPITDPNAAQRRTTTPTPQSEKSVADLKSDLRKFAPGFVNDLLGES